MVEVGVKLIRSHIHAQVAFPRVPFKIHVFGAQMGIITRILARRGMGEMIIPLGRIRKKGIHIHVPIDRPIVFNVVKMGVIILVPENLEMVVIDLRIVVADNVVPEDGFAQKIQNAAGVDIGILRVMDRVVGDGVVNDSRTGVGAVNGAGVLKGVVTVKKVADNIR